MASMHRLNPEFIEKYQKLMEKEPYSKAFAPLAEGYRKIGLNTEAIRLCQAGIKNHPNFPGGYITLAKIYLAEEEYKLALKHLNKVIQLSPDNLLAHSLMSEVHLKLHNPKAALKAFKMLLFLNPKHQKAKIAVKKLESLTANEYDEDIFTMKPIHNMGENKTPLKEILSPISKSGAHNTNPKENSPPTSNGKAFERLISLTDAFIVRNDFEKAEETLSEAEQLFGLNKDIIKRKKILTNRYEPPTLEEKNELEEITKAEQNNLINHKIALLKNVLNNIRTIYK